MATEPPTRNLAMELVRTTEAAALAAANWVGRGDKEGADGAAVDAMRLILGTVSMTGTVIIGEGEKDEAPMLYNGEVVGDGSPTHVDIAVDPIDGTTLTSKGRGGAVAVIAVSETRHDVRPGPVRLHGEDRGRARGRGRHRPRTPRSATTFTPWPRRKGIDVRGGHRRDPRPAPPRGDHRRDPRGRSPHPPDHRRRRRRGDRRAFPDSGVDILFGVGGTPEGVIAAAALKCTGGELLGRLWPRDDTERDAAMAAGYDLDRVLDHDDLVAGDNCFFAATGITDGDLLKGVHYSRLGATTQSLVMRSRSGTVRYVNAHHRLEKLGLKGR